VKVFHNKNLIATIGHHEQIELPEKIGTYTFKLDYHKTEIKLDEFKNDKLLILVFSFKNKFPFYFTDIMFKNSLRIKEVSIDDFNNFGDDYYNIPKQSSVTLDLKKIVSISLA
jgi:hypothetical protein